MAAPPRRRTETAALGWIALGSLVALGLYAVFDAIGWADPLENITVDARFRARAPFDPPSHEDLLLLAIDERTLELFGRYPFDRNRYAELCDGLAYVDEQGGEPFSPKVVAFDLIFSEPSKREFDESFANVAGPPLRVVTGAFTDPSDDGGGEELFGAAARGPTEPLRRVEGDPARLNGAKAWKGPYPELRARSHFAFVDANPTGQDGIRRRLPLLVRAGEEVYPSLALSCALFYWGVSPADVRVVLGQYVEIPTAEGPRRIPINERGELFLNYRANESFVAFPLAVLSNALFTFVWEGNPLPEGLPRLKGRIVMVGQTATGLTDLGPNPLAPISPLVLTHLNALNNILREDYLKAVPGPAVGFFWMLVTVTTAWGLRRRGAALALGLPLAVVAGYLLAAFGLFAWRSLQLPVFWPVAGFLTVHVGVLVGRWVQARKEQAAIKNVFGRFVDKRVLGQILANPDAVKLGGELKPVTIFFSDIRGFTAWSEGLSPEALVQQLNEYFQKMVPCVLETGGTLHKYIGDAVMAVWGDITPRPADDARAAIRACLRMRVELARLNEAFAAGGRKQLKIGMGLNHGEVLVGQIGADTRLEFTVIGDAVNLASRLEGTTKEFHTDLIIGESVEELVRGEFLTRTAGFIQVKGRTAPVKIHEVIAEAADPAPKFSRAWVDRFELAFAARLERQFSEAAALFEECLWEHPDDELTREYLEECHDLQAHPPPGGWTGVLVMKTK